MLPDSLVNSGNRYYEALLVELMWSLGKAKKEAPKARCWNEALFSI